MTRAIQVERTATSKTSMSMKMAALAGCGNLCTIHCTPTVVECTRSCPAHCFEKEAEHTLIPIVEPAAAAITTEQVVTIPIALQLVATPASAPMTFETVCAKGVTIEGGVQGAAGVQPQFTVTSSQTNAGVQPQFTVTSSQAHTAGVTGTRFIPGQQRNIMMTTMFNQFLESEQGRELLKIWRSTSAPGKTLAECALRTPENFIRWLQSGQMIFDEQCHERLVRLNVALDKVLEDSEVIIGAGAGVTSKATENRPQPETESDRKIKELFQGFYD